MSEQRRRILPWRTALLALWGLAGVLSLVLVVVLASWPLPAPATAGLTSRPIARRASRVTTCKPRTPCLVVIIDDIGRDVSALRKLLALPLPLTFSVLPHAPQTGPSLALLRAAKRRPMLHLPLEPRDRDEISDEPLVGTLDRPIAPVLDASLRRVAGAVAVNNHMGSAFTEDAIALKRLFGALRRHQLPFVDSRTTPRSVACRVARQVGLNCLTRDVFLDDPIDPATVEYRLAEAERIARRRGWAIAIGHPFARTIGALDRFTKRFTKRPPGARVVHLMRLMRRQSHMARRLGHNES